MNSTLLKLLEARNNPNVAEAARMAIDAIESDKRFKDTYYRYTLKLLETDPKYTGIIHDVIELAIRKAKRQRIKRTQRTRRG